MPLTPRLRSTRRAALCLATLAIGAVALVTPVPSAGAGAVVASVELPTPTTATATPRAGGVDVTWVSAVDAHRWKVLAFSDGRYVGQRTFAGAAREGRVDHLTPGTAITVWVVAVSEDGWWGVWTTAPAVTLPRDPSCPATSGSCVHVDARTTTGPATGTGLGILHGQTSETDPARVSALSPRHWRVSALDHDRFLLAEASGATTTVLLSDPWSWYTQRPDGRVAAPWQDFAIYRWWVTTIAAWHQEAGLIPDRWEVQNEPSDLTFDPAYPMTPELLVEQHAVAAEAIRSVFPGAEVVGSAVSPFLFGHGTSDVEAFISQSATRDYGLGALTWHENTGACATCDGGPASVRHHIDDARAALQAAGIGDLPIDITEYGAPYEQLQPGAIVGYLSALTGGGVRYGGTTCWDRPTATGAIASSCFTTPGTLDGLLEPDGTTPTDAWWTYRAYAQLASAGARLAVTSVDDPAASAVAAVGAGGSVRSLIGRHVGCTAADGWCPAGTTPGAPEPVTVRMTAPSAGSWTITVSKITSGTGPSSGPVVLKSSTVTAGTTAFTVGAFTIADGDVLVIDATLAAPPKKGPSKAR